MKSRSLLLKSAVVFVLAVTAILRQPARAAAAQIDTCRQCATVDICQFMGGPFCEMACGLPYAGCGGGTLGCEPFPEIICSDDQS